MAFEEVKGETTDKDMKMYSAAKSEKEGILQIKVNENLTGFLKGRKKKVDPKNPEKFYFLYFLKLENGEDVGLFSTGQLVYKMDKIQEGDFIRITYLGKEKVEGYLQALHQWKVEIDPTKRQFEEITQEVDNDTIPF